MYTNNALLIASNEQPVFMLPQMAARHGLITGATGTGKTVTVKVLAEAFSDAGVPVFLSDIKGDLTGMSIPGQHTEDLQKRIDMLGLSRFGWQYKAFPTVYWDVFAHKGIPVRATISEMGPLLLSRLMDLSAAQEGVLNIIFRIADDQGLLLLDVTPLSLGVETQGGVMTKIIERNTTIPTKKSQIFSTAADNQTQVEVNVLQGEREFARDNKQLGLFKLDGIAPAMRGVPQIEVTFDIDANGIVNVSAKDLGTGREQHITITSNTNMSKDDIDKAIHDAEAYAAEDKKRREEVDKRNDAENLVYAVEKLINENGEHISDSDKENLNNKVAAVKSALSRNNIDDIQLAKDELQKDMYAVSEKLYQDAAAQGAAQNQAPEGDNGVYNADYTDIDDN